MSIWDNLFGPKKKPGRGGGSVDDDTDPASYTRVIPKESEPAERSRPAAGGWDDEPRAPEPQPERREEWAMPQARSTPPRAADSYRPEPVRAADIARAHSRGERSAPEPESSGEETVLAPVRAAPTKVVAVLVCVDGPIEGHVVRIYQGENVIGRKGKPESERLPDEARTVSREHARVTAEDGYFMVQPMRPENATIVNDTPVEGHEALQHGDRLTLGATKPATFVLLVVP